MKKIAAAILMGLALVVAIGFLADIVFQKDDLGTSAGVEEQVTAEVSEQTIPDEPAKVEEPAQVKEPAVIEEPLSLGALLASATADQGQRIFGRCRACHDNSEEGNHKIGPNLYGVVGAEVGRFGDFKYSSALSNYDGTWTPRLLDAYLASPKDAIPGNKMTFLGPG